MGASAIHVVLLVGGLAMGAAGLALLLPTDRLDRHAAPDRNDSPTNAWFVNVADASGLLFRHRSGHVEKAYMPEIMSGGVALFDFDGDGLLDVYFVQAGRVSGATPETPGNQLFRNTGKLRFVEVTQHAGVGDIGYGTGCATGDFDGDGWIDLYVTNAGPNVLYHNNGDGTFQDEARGAAYSGTGVAEASMGIDAIDVDNNGYVDLFMTHFDQQTNTLYLNQDGRFIDRTSALGLAASFPYTAFGTGLVDFNNDGFLDIYIANGKVTKRGTAKARGDGYAEPNQLFRGTGMAAFEEVLPRGGTAALLVHTSRGAAFGDLDNDGDVDIVVVNRDALAYLLENRAGGANHWVSFRVLDPTGADAIGARIHVEINGRKIMREVRTAYSYCSANDPRIHIGLGTNSQIQKATVTWVDGAVEEFAIRGLNRTVELHRNRGSMKNDAR